MSEAETKYGKLADALRSFVDNDPSYYLSCSDCECVSESWHNSALAAADGVKEGWRLLGDAANGRILCPICVPKYPALATVSTTPEERDK